MPTVTIQRSLALSDVRQALQEGLGPSYQVTAHGEGTGEALKVKKPPASLATVHLQHTGNATSVHVHGGGLVISRMINEFGIAKDVSRAIEEAFATH
jgi:hypothetical protein